ncbi:MAG: sulfite exporter TauE/SafE family protein [Hydrococcus sp. RU_2_2]|nr:sulfite exporter TauE/SafE family protein [Hydrococcus sp. RU_2_2]NJP19016.1 sulfite exporter TauE/SafE family protein [Hydrococcus sp. CRU_1_1]
MGVAELSNERTKMRFYLAIFSMFPSITNLLPGNPLFVAYGVIVALGAGFVRGFAGFGFSAFTVAGLSLLFSPDRIVPASMLLEVFASLSLLRSVWQDISWLWLKPLIFGNAIAVPLGVWSLAIIPSAPLQALVSGVILCASGLLLSDIRLPWSDTPQLRFATGLLSGFFNGLSAVGGMIVAVMLFSTLLSPKTSRATLISFFFMSYVYALCWAQGQGLIDTTMFEWVLCLVSSMLVGIALGQRHFFKVSEMQFRRIVLQILAVISTLGLARSFFKWQ